MSQFQDLGKATRRGIKKCIKCGVYNGTKSIACKNKSCDMVFKDSSEKRRIISNAVQLITGNFRKLYSVRVRDQGPDCRGFVQLPLSTSATDNERGQLSEVALCFVDNCPRLFQNSILQCQEVIEGLWHTTNLCPHINASLRSRITATPLFIKLHVILKLKSVKEIQEKIWIMTNESNIPLVQRISKNVLAVRCQVTPKHPLGYIHFTFNTRKDKEKCRSHFCDCSDFANNSRCIHFYLCICALASDAKYAQEFYNYIDSEFEEISEPPIDLHKLDRDIHKFNLKEAYGNDRNRQLIVEPTKRKTDKCNTYHKIERRRITSKIHPILVNIISKNNKINIVKENNLPTNPIWTFENWLCYVVESMNRLIIFENAGRLNSLIFDIPLNFYQALRQRIPMEYLGLNAGVLNYEVIHVMKIAHVKQIFDGTKIKLRVSKRFVLTENSSYVEVDENEETGENMMPHFIYFLNVGQLTVDDSDDTNNPFSIEWMFNYKDTTVGQLKLQFKYGRKCL